MIISKGYGKVILFGEHFAVYGHPALVSSLHTATTATIRPTLKPGFQVVDRRPESPGYKTSKREQQNRSITLMTEALNLDLADAGIEITFDGDLIAASGVGASAASCTAFARAASAYFWLDLDDEAVNSIAFEGEKAYHGNPSGMDNTASTYGGLLRFTRNLADRTIRHNQLTCPITIPIVLGDTGITSNTAAVVEAVRKNKEKNPQHFGAIVAEYQGCLENAIAAIKRGDLLTLAGQIDLNHRLLLDLNLSCPTSDELIEIARSNGAIGAKITGTGRGGMILAIAENPDQQNRIASAMDNRGYRSYVTSIGKSVP